MEKAQAHRAVGHNRDPRDTWIQRHCTQSLDFQQMCKDIFSGEIIVFLKNSAGTIRNSYAKT